MHVVHVATNEKTCMQKHGWGRGCNCYNVQLILSQGQKIYLSLRRRKRRRYISVIVDGVRDRSTFICPYVDSSMEKVNEICPSS